MLNYYTKLLGLDGKINKQAVLVKQDRHKLQEEVETLNGKVNLLTNALNVIATKYPDVQQVLMNNPNIEDISLAIQRKKDA